MPNNQVQQALHSTSTPDVNSFHHCRYSSSHDSDRILPPSDLSSPSKRAIALLLRRLHLLAPLVVVFMARKKVKLSFIVNDSIRNATYRKRSKGLLKKVSELSTLCGVEAAVVALNPTNSQPDVWPTVSDLVSTLKKFRDLPEDDQIKKSTNQEMYYRNKIEKLNEQAKKFSRLNWEINLETLFYRCLAGQSLEGFDSQEFVDLAKMIEEKLMEAEERLKDLKRMDTIQPVQQLPSVENNGGLSLLVEALKDQTWFMEARDTDQHVGATCRGGGTFDLNIDGFTGDT